jgi:hypothetical protein
LSIRWRGNVFTEPLPSNERLLWLHYSGLQASCHVMSITSYDLHMNSRTSKLITRISHSKFIA